MRRDLALACRGALPIEEVVRWCSEVMKGRDPDDPNDKTGESPFAPRDWQTRWKAFETLMHYGYGPPTQYHAIHAELAKLEPGERGAVQQAVLAGLDAGTLDAARGAMRALAGALAAPIDASAVERPLKK